MATRTGKTGAAAAGGQQIKIHIVCDRKKMVTVVRGRRSDVFKRWIMLIFSRVSPKGIVCRKRWWRRSRCEGSPCPAKSHRFSRRTTGVPQACFGELLAMASRGPFWWLPCSRLFCSWLCCPEPIAVRHLTCFFQAAHHQSKVRPFGSSDHFASISSSSFRLTFHFSFFLGEEERYQERKICNMFV